MIIPGMKNIGSLYEDKKGNIWLLKQEKLPKKKGEYRFWIAESIEGYIVGDIELKEEKKRVLLNKIANFEPVQK